MENFLRYFEIKYSYNELLEFNSVDKDVVTLFSVSKSNILQNFFKNVLEYYLSHDILLDYNDISITADTKYKIIQKLYSDDKAKLVFITQVKAVKLFDMIDFMFKTFKKVIIRYNKGYLKWLEDPKVMKIKFSSVIMPNIDLFFYIVFVHFLPNDLREILRKELHISDLEYNVLNKCSGILIKDYKNVCNIKVPNAYVSIKKPDGILMIMKIFNDFRQFNKRRPSKIDNFNY